jgi:hypothetical protein
MDRTEDGAKKSFDWLSIHMPGVAKLVKEKRRLHGDKHVNECWRRGVLQREPGWFFAREGALAVGTPWADDPAMANFAAASVTATQALLVMKAPEVVDGTH